jgi:carboxypeptidase PM20D1
MAIFWEIGAAVVIVAAVCLFRAAAAGKKDGGSIQKEAGEPVSLGQAARNLSDAVRCKTVSHDDPAQTDFSQFEALQQLLRERYPLFHQAAQREIVDGYTLLYRWPGSGEGAVLFVAHQDVVDPGQGWEEDPFGGEIKEGYLWGRGSLDMKSQLIALFEGAEALLQEDFRPKKDIYFALTHNEETSYETGARTAAALLQERGIRFEFVLDEGTNSFIDGEPFGLSETLAAVSVCEKRYGVLEVSARGRAGHSSAPDRETALSAACAAAARIARQKHKARISPVLAALYDALLPRMPFGKRLIYANRFLTAPLILKKLSKMPGTNALIRTTAAATTAKGAAASNILPERAAVNFNYRLAPWDDAGELERRAGKRAGKGARARFTALPQAPHVSRMDSPGYELIRQTAQRVFGLPVVPMMMLGATDSNFFYGCSDCIYRFSPFRPYEQQRIHAAGERISLEALEGGLVFFKKLLEKC